jgi:hypothetical protein
MQVPKVHGVIGRRLLVNFRAEPGVVQRQLPPPFRAKLHEGHAVAGICLIRLDHIRPKRFPRMLGLSSENAAHRIAVLWDDDNGSHEGVYIPRRDTGSLMNHLVGGRLFPGEHHRATFRVEDTGDRIALEMMSADGHPGSCWLGDSGATDDIYLSDRQRSVGVLRAWLGRLPATASGRRLDGVVLKTHSWSVSPLAIERVSSTYFADETVFPAGTVTFDCALIMRNIAHEWQAGTPMYI